MTTKFARKFLAKRLKDLKNTKTSRKKYLRNSGGSIVTKAILKPLAQRLVRSKQSKLPKTPAPLLKTKAHPLTRSQTKSTNSSI